MSSKKLIAIAIASAIVATSSAFAATSKTYQVTGPVLEISNDKIIVQKGKDKWEIERANSTKIPDGVKVGDKVTIEYKMTATDIEEKSAPKAAKEKASKTGKAAKDTSATSTSPSSKK